MPRSQSWLIAGLLALALAGWIITDRRMAGMDAGPGTDLGTLGFYTTAWVVMMAAMMFPAIVPMVLMYRMIDRRHRDQARVAAHGSTSLFVAGYLASWTGFGLLAYALFVGVRSLSIDAFSWHRGGPYLAGGVLLAAAVYQLTPTKHACLTRCRGPLQFLTDAWRDGRLGAFLMGIEYGSWCVGCCWALMAALFALGAMSVGWMVFVAALIAIERLLPWTVPANRSIAAVLAGLAIAIALAPADVPDLTLPGSAAAQRAMSMMHRGSAMDGNMAPSRIGPRTTRGLSQAGFHGGFESRTICPRGQENLRRCQEDGNTHRS